MGTRNLCRHVPTPVTRTPVPISAYLGLPA
jgi:hypothetical protein